MRLPRRLPEKAGGGGLLIRLATDNDFNELIARGIRRVADDLDLTSIRDFGLARAEDAEILAWAATTGHVVISHDASTMTAAAYERLERGEPVGGLVIVPQRLGIGEAVRRLVRLLSEAEQGDLSGRVVYL